MKWNEWLSKLNIFVVGILGTATAIISFAILFRQNFQLALVVSVAILLVILWAYCLYIILARSQSQIVGAGKRFRFPRARVWASFVMGSTLLLLFASLFLQPVREFGIHAFEGTPTLYLSPVSISNVRVGETVSHDDYVIETTVQNPTGREQLITELRVIAGETRVNNCFGVVSDFRIAKSITVTKDTDNGLLFNGAITQDSPALSGVLFPVQGSIYRTCGSFSLNLDFSASIPIPKDTYSTLIVYIPEEFDVAKDQSCLGGCPSRPTERIYIPLLNGSEKGTIITRGTPTTTTYSTQFAVPPGSTSLPDQNELPKGPLLDGKYVTIEAIIDQKEIMPYTLNQSNR